MEPAGGAPPPRPEASSDSLLLWEERRSHRVSAPLPRPPGATRLWPLSGHPIFSPQAALRLTSWAHGFLHAPQRVAHGSTWAPARVLVSSLFSSCAGVGGRALWEEGFRRIWGLRSVQKSGIAPQKCSGNFWKTQHAVLGRGVRARELCGRFLVSAAFLPPKT